MDESRSEVDPTNGDQAQPGEGEVDLDCQWTLTSCQKDIYQILEEGTPDPSNIGPEPDQQICSSSTISLNQDLNELLMKIRAVKAKAPKEAGLDGPALQQIKESHQQLGREYFKRAAPEVIPIKELEELKKQLERVLAAPNGLYTTPANIKDIPLPVVKIEEDEDLESHYLISHEDYTELVTALNLFEHKVQSISEQKDRANDHLYKLAQYADRYAQSYNSLLNMAELLAGELLEMTALLKTYGPPKAQDHSQEERLADAVLLVHERLASLSGNRFHKIMDLVDKRAKVNAAQNAPATKSAAKKKAVKPSRSIMANPIVNLVRLNDPMPPIETPKFGSGSKIHISDRLKQHSKRKRPVSEPAKTDDRPQPSQSALPSPSRSLRSTPARNVTANKGVLNQIKTSPVSKKRRSGSESKRDRSKDDWHSIITSDGRENGRYLVLKINAYHKWKRLADRYHEDWLNQRSNQEGIVAELETATDPTRRRILNKVNQELIRTIAKTRASRNKKIRKLHQRWTIFMTFDLDFAKKHLGSPPQYPMTSRTRRSISDHTRMMQTGSPDDIELAESRIQKFYEEYPEYNKTRRLLREQSGAEPSDNQTTDEDESELEDTEIEEELEEENEDENDIRNWSKSPNQSFLEWSQQDNENETAIERTTESDQTTHSEFKADSDDDQDEEP